MFCNCKASTFKKGLKSVMQLTATSTMDTGYAEEAVGDALPRLHISSKTLKHQALRFLHGFNGSTSYAVKANDNPDIIRNLHSAGISHFDVASIPEMEAVKSAAPFSRLHYHNPVRSIQELQTALLKYNCRRFAVDHLDELEKIAAIVADPSQIEIAIRFRDPAPSQAVQAFKSKFGASELEAAQLLLRAKARSFRTGLTFHPGSQTLNPEPYVHHIATASRISKTSGVKLDFLNVGGGFPANYTGLEPQPLKRYFTAIADAVARNFGSRAPLLECEPGRALVAEAGILETRIKAIRRDRCEVFLNDGIYGGLMEVSQFPDLQPQYELSGNPCPRHNLQEWTAYGPTCDPIDVLPFKLALPGNIAEGQRLNFHGVGAYSTATATRFNGYGCIDVAIDY